MPKAQQERYTLEQAGYELVEKRYQTVLLRNKETGETEIFFYNPRATGFVVQIQQRPYQPGAVLG